MRDRVYIHRAGHWYSLFMNRENETALASIADVSSEGGRKTPLGSDELVRRIEGCKVILSLNGYGASEISWDVLRRVRTVRLIAIAHSWEQFSQVPLGLPIEVMETSNSGTVAVAEWCLSAALMGIRKIHVFDKRLKNGSAWGEPRRSVGLLTGSTVGLIGLGRVGTYLSRAFRSLGVNVIACSETCSLQKAQSLGIRLVDLEQLLTTARIVSLHRADVGSPKCVLGAREFSLMRPDCILINSGRAALYDEKALINELRAGRFDAYIDVFSIEPLPMEHAFRSLPNVTITPHIAGNNAEMFTRCARESIAWLKGFLDGKPMNDRRYDYP